MSRIFACSVLGAMLVCASARAQSVPVTVLNTAAQPVPTTITNTPAVTVANPVQVTGSVQVTNTPSVIISGAPTVTVASLPSGGTPYFEGLSADITVNGAVPGTRGTVVPPGKRRIVSTVSARWVCTHGHGAVLQLFTNVGLFLPGRFEYTDAINRDAYVSLTKTNLIVPSGFKFIPIIESDGSTCHADIYVAGVEVPDSP